MGGSLCREAFSRLKLLLPAGSSMASEMLKFDAKSIPVRFREWEFFFLVSGRL
jgi:hypothetical protein